TKGLIEKGLFAAAKKIGTAGICRADVARRRNATAIEKRFGCRGEIQESLLAKDIGPDRFVAFELVAVERIVPPWFCVQILAFAVVATVLGLLKLPAVGNFVVDISDWRQHFRRRVENIRRIGVEAMAEFAVRTERFFTGG